MTNRIYLDSDQQAWIEPGEEYVVVSWPGGHVLLSYEVTVPEILNVIRVAVDDLLAARPTKVQTRNARRKSYDDGWNDGWAAGKKQAAS